MDNNTITNWKAILFYRYFPIASPILCIMSMYILDSLSVPKVGDYIFFFVWPGSLIFWLIYWAKRNPSIKRKTYYLLVFWFLCILALALISSVMYKIFQFSSNAKEKVSEFLGIVIWFIFFALVVYKLWPRRKNSDKQIETKALK